MISCLLPSNMHVLLAWELGGNYGHIAKLLCIAQHLRQRGHRVLFGVKNMALAGQLLDKEKFCYIQAPRSFVRRSRFDQPVSFADILAGAGFGNSEVLEGLVRSWQDIFENMKVDVVVAQYAPVAQFSARLSGVPCLSLNTGFECPPDIPPFPCFRPHLRLTRERLLAREKQILEQINMTSFCKSHYSCRNLQTILTSDVNLLTTLPELDHYRQRQNGCYIGPISMVDRGITLPWREGSTVRIFVYLRPFVGIELILEALASSSADVIAHIPGIDSGVTSSYDNTSVRIAGSVVKLSGLLADMDVAITHGSHGTTAAALLAGVPMLVIPTTIEQWLMSRTIEHLGVGIALRKEQVARNFSSALERVLADRSFTKSATKMAVKYAGYDQERVMVKIVNTVERLRERQVENI